jgi:electron transfer flavoprotein alpha subunit
MPEEHKDILVLVEHREETPVDVSYEMLDDARKLADSLKQQVIAVVLGGPDLPDVTRKLAVHGADRVLYGRHARLQDYETRTFVGVMAGICRDVLPATVILPATPNGQDLAARLAARLGVGLISSCLKFTLGPEKAIQGVKETHQGKVYATLSCTGPRPHLFTFKPGAVGVGPESKRRTAKATELETLCIPEETGDTRTLEFIPADPRTVDLTEADMIVGGGAGVGDRETFEQLQELADLLGASVGGTRPAVDHGWIPFERQIGQTGKIVSPRLYLAAGISGASLHTMGIKDAENIIAINTDTNAPIFKMAHLSAMNDLREVLPVLVEKLKQRIAQTGDTTKGS